MVRRACRQALRMRREACCPYKASVLESSVNLDEGMTYVGGYENLIRETSINSFYSPGVLPLLLDLLNVLWLHRPHFWCLPLRGVRVSQTYLRPCIMRTLNVEVKNGDGELLELSLSIDPSPFRIEDTFRRVKKAVHEGVDCRGDWVYSGLNDSHINMIEFVPHSLLGRCLSRIEFCHRSPRIWVLGTLLKYQMTKSRTSLDPCAIDDGVDTANSKL